MFNLFKKKEKAKVKGKEEVKELGLFNEMNNIEVFTMKVKLEGYERKSKGTIFYVMEKRRSERTVSNFYNVYFKIGNHSSFIWKSKFSSHFGKEDREFIDKFLKEWEKCSNSESDYITLNIGREPLKSINDDPRRSRNYIKYEDGTVIDSYRYNVIDDIRLLDDKVYNEQENRNY